VIGLLFSLLVIFAADVPEVSQQQVLHGIQLMEDFPEVTWEIYYTPRPYSAGFTLCGEVSSYTIRVWTGDVCGTNILYIMIHEMYHIVDIRDNGVLDGSLLPCIPPKNGVCQGFAHPEYVADIYALWWLWNNSREDFWTALPVVLARCESIIPCGSN
jgi:hypothetical protein